MNKVLIVLLVLVGVATRLIPHPPNFTPILSVALLSGAYFKNRLSFLIPVLIMLVSDIFIGGHLTTMWVYSSMLIVFLIGFYLIKKQSMKNVMISSVVGSLLFFAITNFGVWLIGYPNTLSGFIACYVAAIPFYKNTLLSALLYSGAIHGSVLYFKKYYFVYDQN